MLGGSARFLGACLRPRSSQADFQPEPNQPWRGRDIAAGVAATGEAATPATRLKTGIIPPFVPLGEVTSTVEIAMRTIRGNMQRRSNRSKLKFLRGAVIQGSGRPMPTNMPLPVWRTFGVMSEDERLSETGKKDTA
jgi:hypothetical protein